jgi:Leucine-rich repeat (LRR) protein
MRRILIAICLLFAMACLSLAQEETQTPYEIALERILEAERTGVARVDLAHLQLTELPPEIGNLNNLQELYLYNNRLNSIPSTIGDLDNLQHLRLDNNQLSNLPS